ncbi:unnamed protein product [Parascedosporium putredinis]|uniref:DUF676 domain-containing protein n=1 Tax=Parascedosporium putredinis TaxID=1442378 RepID=A0A9P1H0H8_9PEZI|nr:unnamed protein product [Parascedosporium putredinis]CAI7991816.1 unnamed protein product [Parascedosporium putredinis]
MITDSRACHFIAASPYFILLQGRKMPRTLLLCYIHGFKVRGEPRSIIGQNDIANSFAKIQGSDDTFHAFPEDLKKLVSEQLPDDHVESIVYPKYETKGDLSQASEALLEWLKGQVMEVRKSHVEAPWPPNDRQVGVILVAHSMGPVHVRIRRILELPKVSNVFNVMATLSAAAPATLGRLAARRAAGSAASAATSSIPASSPAWKAWQLVAVRTGTVGAIAAGGAAAYMHREAIARGLRSVRNLNREAVVDGYRQGVGALGQGLAYINRGNVGRSYAWLADHFTFVGALLKPNELSRRLGRLAALRGVGIHDVYCSLGENGYWSGGYFVPERTFCAVPEPEHDAYNVFSRCVVAEAEDEIQAHMGMFEPKKNAEYAKMTENAAKLAVEWFLSEEPVVDDEKFRDPPPEEAAEDTIVKETLEEAGAVPPTAAPEADAESEKPPSLPDVSPVDIAAAASVVPLPDDDEAGGDLVDTVLADSDEKKTYMKYLFEVAQQTGTGIKDTWYSKMPDLQSSTSSLIPTMPSVNLPSVNMPSVNLPSVSMPSMSMPSVNIFSKKAAEPDSKATTTTGEEEKPAEKEEQEAGSKKETN